jgi:hypothetical protein
MVHGGIFFKGITPYRNESPTGCRYRSHRRKENSHAEIYKGQALKDYKGNSPVTRYYISLEEARKL